MRNKEIAQAFNVNSKFGYNTLHFSYIPQSGASFKRCFSYCTCVALGEYKSYEGMSATTAKHLCYIEAKPLWGAFNRRAYVQPSTYEDLARNIERAFESHRYSLNMNRKECREEYRAMLKAYRFMRQFLKSDDAANLISNYSALYMEWKKNHKERARQEEEIFFNR